jgi:PAS domain S-box-containing protein
LAVFFVFLLAAFMTWQKNAERKRSVREYAASLASQQIDQFLDERASDLKYISNQWDGGGALGRVKVLKAAHAIYDNHPEYQGIRLMGPDGITLGGCSDSSSHLGLWKSGWSDPVTRKVFVRAQAAQGQIQMSDAVTLGGGEEGVVLAKALGRSSKPEGYICAALPIRSLLNLVDHASWGRDFEARLLFNPPPIQAHNLFTTNVIRRYGQTLQLEMLPKVSAENDLMLAVPFVLVCAGLFLALLVGYWVWRMEREENRIRNIDRRFQSALENSYDIIWSVVPGKGLTFVSHSFSKLFGYSEKDAANKKIEDLVYGEDRHLIRESIERLQKNETIRHEFTRCINAQGHHLWLESTATPTLDTKGRLIQVDGASRDVTESRSAEDKFRRLIETSSDLVVEADNTGRILFANNAIYSILGVKPADAEGHLLWDYVHPDTRSRVRNEVKRKWLETGSAEFEARFLHTNGSDRFLGFRLKSEPSIGREPMGFQAVGRDITAQRLMENQVQQFQKMEAIGKLAGGMAHDFNNLLTVILSHAEGAAQDLPPDDTAQKDLKQIQKAARRAAELTRQVLTFSRRYPVEPVELNLNVVVAEMEDFLKQLLPAGVTLEVQSSDDLSWVMADRSQMEQVIMNLVLNAKDAMPQGGTIRVLTRNMELTEPLAQGPNYFPAGRWVVVEVRDGGKGIPAENVEHIFEPFYTTKCVGQGTGLGLSVVYGIVRAHQGGLHVETETGQGTTVRVFLPFVQPASVSVASAGVQRVLLVVEPDDFNRKVLRRLLDLMGYSLYMAVDTTEAAMIAGKGGRKFDLLLMTLQDGLEAAEKFHQSLQASQKRIGLVLLDGTPAGMGSNPSGFVLQPPYDVDRVANVIQNALDNKEASMEEPPPSA